jgi:hypothetical protein
MSKLSRRDYLRFLAGGAAAAASSRAFDLQGAVSAQLGERHGNEYLEFPTGTDGRFPENEVKRTEIVLGEQTTNTCNIAIADVDGDGLDEIATPLTIGEQDCVRLYRGDGTLVWNNSDVRLYHAFYNDPTPPRGGILHMWHRSKHRHVLTEIADFDGDGRPEVIVGDGPIYILNALTGTVKSVFDLGGRVALWNTVYEPRRNMRLLVACADDRRKGPRVVALDPAGQELWALPTPGKGFCDCMHHGDLDLDGRPEIGFSVEETKEFWVIDCDGKLRWKKNVLRELGHDSHVDDFLIDRILPGDRMQGSQLLLATGPNLLDRNGKVIWSRRDVLDHAQKVLAADLYPERPGKEVYTVESYRRHAYLLTCDGQVLWDYGDFTRAREKYASPDPRLGRAIGRLTTAGDLVNWSGNGKVEIVQAEMGGSGKSIPSRAIRRFMHILDRKGKPVIIFPIDDSPMCVRAAHVTRSSSDDIVMVGHETSTIYIFSRKHRGDRPPETTIGARASQPDNRSTDAQVEL